LDSGDVSELESSADAIRGDERLLGRKPVRSNGAGEPASADSASEVLDADTSRVEIRDASEHGFCG
jgi:hypothetical protein